MKLAVAACPIDWHNRWNEYVGKLRVWVRTAVEGGAEVLVFPEFAALELATLAGEENAADPRRATDALSARMKDVDDLHASLAREFGAHILAASGPVRGSDGRVLNRARLFAPDGGRGAADQAAPGPVERATWEVAPAPAARVFETSLGRIGVLIGADVTEAGLAASMAAAGARLLLAPTRAGTPEEAEALGAAAAARAAETGAVVAQAVVVGDADWCAALGRSFGAAAVHAPPGAEGAPDDAAAPGRPDAPGWVFADAPAAAEAAAGATADAAWPVEVTALAPPPSSPGRG